MSYYSTGEVAERCGITVRTVQYYDKENLIKPSMRSEGGRRMYTEEDVQKLQEICMMKSLGVSLSSIREVLETPNGHEVLRILLAEHVKEMDEEIEQLENRRKRILTVKDAIDAYHWLPVKTEHDIDTMMMERKKLKKVYAITLAIGLFMDVLEIAGIVYFVKFGSGKLFFAVLPFVAVLGGIATGIYRKYTVYICPECHEVFKPRFGQWLLAYHTPKLRKVTCVKCGYKGLCVETCQKTV